MHNNKIYENAYLFHILHAKNKLKKNQTYIYVHDKPEAPYGNILI